MKKIFVLFILLSTYFAVFGQTYKSGTISSPDTWSGTIYLTDDVTITSTVTINAGTQVLFKENNITLTVDNSGSIDANGTSGNEVYFSADHDEDSNYGESAANNDEGDFDERGLKLNFYPTSSSSGTSYLDYCIIEYIDCSNEAGSINYGSMYMIYGTVELDNCTIRNNKAKYGGAIFLRNTSRVSLENSTIKDNIATSLGGALYFGGEVTALINNCHLINNSAVSGGGIYILYGHPTIKNCLVISNSASSAGSGVYFAYANTSAKLLNCVIANNTSSGSALDFQYLGQSGRLPSIVNTIIWGSSIGSLNNSYISVTNSAIEGFSNPEDHTNSFSLSSTNGDPNGPNFTNPSSDWSIKFISPCRDTGTDTGAPTTDYDGDSRIGTTDIGAYEVQYSRWTGGASTIIWSTAGNWDESITPTNSTSDVIIPTGLSYYPTGSSPSPADYTIGTGKYMIVEPGAQVTLGTLSNSGTLTLESDATGIASLMVNTYSDSGTENIELFITGDGSPNYKWHYISSPVDNLGIATFTGTTTNLLKYDEGLVNADNASLGWRFYNGYDYQNSYVGDGEFSYLYLGKGYDLYNSSEDHTFTLSGTFNTASVSDISLNYNSGSHTEYPDIHGLNLLGNPFTCSLDWDVIDNSLDESISKAIYYTKNNGVASWVNQVGTNGGTNIIPPMQGFFIKTGTDGNTITLPTGARKHDSQARYKGDKTIPLVRLSILQTVSSTEMGPPYITIDSLSDETVVRFDEQAKPELDNDFDAVKMFLSDIILSIYSYTGETKYAINGLPFPEESINIPLAINSPKADTLKIRATQIEGLKDYDIILKDREQDFNINYLKYNEYIFFADSGTVTDRFILTVSRKTTGLPDIFEPEQEKTFNIYSSREILYINPLEDKWNGKRSDLRIYDITGKIVKQLNNIEWQKGVTKEISLNVAQGIYLVEICSASERFVGRVSVVR